MLNAHSLYLILSLAIRQDNIAICVDIVRQVFHFLVPTINLLSRVETKQSHQVLDCTFWTSLGLVIGRHAPKASLGVAVAHHHRCMTLVVIVWDYHRLLISAYSSLQRAKIDCDRAKLLLFLINLHLLN